MYHRSLYLSAAFCLLSGAAQAQTVYITSDATINELVDANTVVGRDSVLRRFNPTVTFITDANVQGYVQVFNQSVVNMNGGTVLSDFSVFNTGVVNLSGGTAQDSLSSFDQSVVNVSGGRIDSYLAAFDHGTVNLSGGTVCESLQSLRNGVVNVTGGQIEGAVFAQGNSTLNLRGGIFDGAFTAFGNSTLNFYGTGLGDLPLYIEGESEFDSYLLHGVLADGSSLDGKTLFIQSGSGVTINFIPSVVPEPGFGAMVLSGAFAAGLLLRRRRR